MAYPAGSHGYYPAPQAGQYGAYYSGFEQFDSRSSRLPRILPTAVAVLGVASYGFGYGPALQGGGGGWPVRFALLAALLAAFGLLPDQAGHGKIVATLAGAGFLDGLSMLINTPDEVRPGWALTVVAVLNGLQACAAIGALFQDAGGAEHDGYPGYDAYADYYQQSSAAEHYQRYSPAPQPDSMQRGGAATALAQHSQRAPAASVGAQAGYGEYERARARDVRYPPSPAAGQTPDTAPAQGLPSVSQAGAAARAHSERPVEQPVAPPPSAPPA